MKEYRLNMLSRADMVKGQGVLSAYEEELRLISGRLDRRKGDSGDFKLNISINDKIDGDITHIHTVNPEFFLRLPAIKSKGIAVGSVHFLPETVDQSLHLPSVARQAFYSYLISFYKSMDRLVTVNPVLFQSWQPTASTRRRSPSFQTMFRAASFQRWTADRSRSFAAAGDWTRSALPLSVPVSCKLAKGCWSLRRLPRHCRRCSLCGREILPSAG